MHDRVKNGRESQAKLAIAEAKAVALASSEGLSVDYRLFRPDGVVVGRRDATGQKDAGRRTRKRGGNRHSKKGHDHQSRHQAKAQQIQAGFFLHERSKATAVPRRQEANVFWLGSADSHLLSGA